MNVAILMSGRTDLFDNVVNYNHENLIKPLRNSGYNVDMFGSFWEEDATQDCINAYADYWKIVDIETFTPYVGGVIKNFNIHKELVKKYQHTDGDKISNTMYWLYKLNRLYGMVKHYEVTHGVKYDYYIRIRPDLGLDKQFDPNHLKCLSDNNIITHVDHVVHIDGKVYGCGDGWVDDNFCVAKQPAFEVYCSVYDNIVSLCNDCQNCTSHILFKKHFEINNIKTLLPNSVLVMPRKTAEGIKMYFYFEYVYYYFGYNYNSFVVDKCI